jgi:2-(1,2-epoxy-1,2-dihydrophenyl)acetyl-CoA isomerase
MSSNSQAYDSSPEASVRAELDDTVLTVTLNRPEVRNAMDSGGWDRLGTVLAAAERDEGVRVVLLQGAGGTFCSGADTRETPQVHPLTRVRNAHRTAFALQSLSKPTVARVEGYAIGAGWDLALCCDLVIAAADAKFCAVFAKRGLSVDFGGSWLLPRLTGLQQAKRLTMLAEMIDAKEAAALGLVTWVCVNSEIDARTEQVCGDLASMPPIALSQMKALLHAGASSSFSEALESEARAQSVNHATEDAHHAAEAGRVGAAPEFTGRWSR